MARKPIYNNLGVLKNHHTLSNAHYAFVRSDPKWKKFPWKVYKEMCQEFMGEMLLEILEGNTAHFWGIGTMKMVKLKVNSERLSIDFNQTKIHGFTVYHINRHSDGYIAKLRWHKFRGKTRGLGFYRFDVSDRLFRKEITKVMKSPGGHKRYQKLTRK